MRLTFIENIILKVLYICAAGIIAFQLFDIERWVSPLFYATFVLEVALWGITAQQKIEKQDFLCLITIYIAFMCVFLNAWQENTSISFSYMKKFIMFSSTLIYFQTVSKLKVDNSVKQFIIKTVEIISICFIVMYYIQTQQMYIYAGRISDYLTFRFTNPNLAAMFLVCFAVLEFIELIKKKHKLLRLFHLILLAMLIFFIIKTQARNACLVIVIFMLIWVITNVQNRREYKFKRIIAFFVAIFPLVFAAVYMLFIRTSFLNQLFEFLQSEGKELDSRIAIWSTALDGFLSSPIFGAYSQISGGKGTSQMHNTHIDVLASYGCVTLILFCIILMIFIYNNNKKYDRESYLYMIGFVVTIIMGMGEAALVSGGLSLNLYAGALLLLANSEK